MTKESIQKNIIVPLYIVVGLSVAVGGGIFLYNTFGTPFVVVWGIGVIIAGAWVTGVLGAMFGPKR